MTTRLRDLPPAVLRPAGWTLWRVKAFTGKNGDIPRGQTFVRADTEQQAKDLGRQVLRLIGVRGRFVVNVSLYYPWLDSAMQGYVAYTDQQTKEDTDGR